MSLEGCIKRAVDDAMEENGDDLQALQQWAYNGEFFLEAIPRHLGRETIRNLFVASPEALNIIEAALAGHWLRLYIPELATKGWQTYRVEVQKRDFLDEAKED